MATPPPPPAPAYLFTDRFARFDYGVNHPLRMIRLDMAHQLIADCGMAQAPYPVVPADIEEMVCFHDRRYLETLQELSENPERTGYLSFGLGVEDNPPFAGMYEMASLLAGGSLKAMRLVSQDGYPTAFNMAGGMHHALAARASGFCYINDIVVAARRLVRRGKRVLYLDIDAHHGDGVQWAFYDTDQVMTISLHQHPATLFPGTGYVEEMGRGAGRGYAVNIPFWPDTDDDIYIETFEELVPPLVEAFDADYIITQLGVDTFLMDPLANLNLTTRGFGHCLSIIRELARGKWIALGGGGYDLLNVARGWALAWAIMLEREEDLPQEFPPSFMERYRIAAEDSRLLDEDEKIRGRFWDRARRDAEDVVRVIKKTAFPVLGARS